MVGPRRTIAKRTRSQKGGRGYSSSAKRTMFFPAKHEKYADIVSFKNPEQAKHSANQLLLDFDMAKTRAKKVRVKRVTVLASSRAKASTQKRILSSKERKEYLEISAVYKKAYEKMVLPER